MCLCANSVPNSGERLGGEHDNSYLSPMTEITAPLSTALADRYKIERHLGEGGMATVYLAPGRV